MEHSADDWKDLSLKIVEVIEKKRKEFKFAAQLEDGDEESILADEVAALLINEYMDGRGPRPPPKKQLD